MAPIVWLAVSEDNISLLELGSMQPIASYSYSHVLTFGGCQEDFMLVINSEDGLRSHKLLFSMSKPKVSSHIGAREQIDPSSYWSIFFSLFSHKNINTVDTLSQVLQ